MSIRFISGTDFIRMVDYGAEMLEKRAGDINALNVFPVPDGDTGTNMNLTFSAGVQAVRQAPSDHIGRVTETLAKGLLMGARGNSGVILSQLFRGFAKGAAGKETMDVVEFAQALQQGVETAYQAVAKPVEGTILSVARDAARYGTAIARRELDFPGFLAEVLKKAQDALAKTPDHLPVLKQVGVVDAGGQGLVILYEAFLNVLSGKTESASVPSRNEILPVSGPFHTANKAQAHLATESIEHGYCTEFIIRLRDEKLPREHFAESLFREEMGKLGDSLLVVRDGGLVKVHIHAEYPGDALNLAMKYGELTRIKIENMREQHAGIVAEGGRHPESQAAPGENHPASGAEGKEEEGGAPLHKACGIVAVVAGEGMKDIFRSMGADGVITGGNTMNPSTEELIRAIEEVQAESVFVLPNNSNIIMTARQAAEMTDKTVEIIPTKTVPQGLAALMAFNGESDAAANRKAMEQAAQRVHTGQITRAVRNTRVGDLEVKTGDFLGLLEDDIVAVSEDMLETAKKLTERLISPDAVIVTLFQGEDASEEWTETLVSYLQEAYPELEVEVYDGGQPLYDYIFSVE